MKITLSFEKTCTEDTSIMVDALRASSTITLAFNNFEKIIPCFSPDEAFEINESENGIIAGERNGVKIEGFDIGNSPRGVEGYSIPSDKNKTLILTTSNGTRILKDMNSKVLVGSLVNAKSVASKSLDISSGEIDVVMAGIKGDFALEDFLASGEILYWIYAGLKEENADFEISDYAKAAILASRDYDLVKKGFYNSTSGTKLSKIGSGHDIDTCIEKNISENVGIYENGILKLI